MMQMQDMPAARLHGSGDLRIDRVPHPGDAPPGHVLLRVEVVGLCGSDLHSYRHACIGDTGLGGPLIMGHEFAGIVEQVGAGAIDGEGRPLSTGTRVAVDPAQPCGVCEWCHRGDTNLCPNMVFCGLWPNDGAMRPYMHVPANTCFPVPEDIDATMATLLEPLGVAIHTVDLSKVRLGESVAVIGTGPIGLCILQLLACGQTGRLFAADRLAERLEHAAEVIGHDNVFCCSDTDPANAILESTAGRGIDVAIEAAASGEALQQAAEMLAPGGRLIVVGIDEADQFVLKHSTARRKGLTIRMVRRMQHVYPRAMQLVQQNQLKLESLVTHRYPLSKAPEAFALNADYRDNVVKLMIDI